MIMWIWKGRKEDGMNGSEPVNLEREVAGERVYDAKAYNRGELG